MSKSKWYAFKCWFFRKIADLVPEKSKRYVLYELRDRVGGEGLKDWWECSYEELYDTLRDK